MVITVGLSSGGIVDLGGFLRCTMRVLPFVKSLHMNISTSFLSAPPIIRSLAYSAVGVVGCSRIIDDRGASEDQKQERH